uniref:Uncharacterized protein n=1 Tax=Chloropicon primus TaxID=1764295 RepID=A0A7S2SZU6_9CHLO|mmetsp:Transcript_14503/g.41316  ORF Transcript_14503/g.41316 Transcript_14503/m.41316 type:complete len:104 (+) Transcript_14503:241-552(+)
MSEAVAEGEQGEQGPSQPPHARTRTRTLYMSHRVQVHLVEREGEVKTYFVESEGDEGGGRVKLPLPAAGQRWGTGGRQATAYAAARTPLESWRALVQATPTRS